MARLRFGDVLRDARERQGIDLHAAARSLRIRPDILQAIEMADFERIPPRGVARCMVNSYARMLGLNSSEVTRMYLDEAYAYEVGRAREDRPRAGAATGRTSSGRSGSRQGQAARSGRPQGSAARANQPDYRSERSDRSQGLTRPLYTDARPDSYRTSPAAQQRLHHERETHSSRRSAMPNSHHLNLYAAPAVQKRTSGYVPFVIAGVVVLILLIVVLSFVFGGKDSSAADDTPKIPVSGLSDPEGAGEASGEEEEGAAVKAPVAPTAAVFKYEVAKGEDAYIEVYVDDGGASVAQTVSGPDSKTFDVTGTLKFVTTNPAGVVATVDGEKVEPVDENGVGVYTYIVDFPAILAKWQEDNAAAIAAAEAANKAKAATDADDASAADTVSGTDSKKASA